LKEKCIVLQHLQTGNSHMALLMAPSGSDIEELKRTRGRLFSRDVDSLTDPTHSTSTATLDNAAQLFGVDSCALLPTPEEDQKGVRQIGTDGHSYHQPGSSSMTRRKQRREKRVSWKSSFTSLSSFTKRISRSPSPVDEAEQQLQELGCTQQQQQQQQHEGDQQRQQADQTYIALDIIQPPTGAAAADVNNKPGLAAISAPQPYTAAAAAAAARAFKSHQGSGAAAAKGGAGQSGAPLPEVPVGIITLEDVMEELLQVRLM
jgi:hypothetical protein